MALDGSEFFIVALLTGAIPIVLGIGALYLVVRFGVKHGMRSYYRDAAQGRDAGA